MSFFRLMLFGWIFLFLVTTWEFWHCPTVERIIWATVSACFVLISFLRVLYEETKK